MNQNQQLSKKSQKEEALLRKDVNLPGYQFIRSIGHGAQGEIYQAVRTFSGVSKIPAVIMVIATFEGL